MVPSPYDVMVHFICSLYCRQWSVNKFRDLTWMTYISVCDGTLNGQRCLVRGVVADVVTCCCLPKVKENLYTEHCLAASCFC